MNIASTLFYACVFIAFCAYIVEKIIQAWAVERTQPDFPAESKALIRSNYRLYKWTQALFITRFILLTIGAFDYFWFM